MRRWKRPFTGGGAAKSSFSDSLTALAHGLQAATLAGQELSGQLTLDGPILQVLKVAVFAILGRPCGNFVMPCPQARITGIFLASCADVCSWRDCSGRCESLPEIQVPIFQGVLFCDKSICKADGVFLSSRHTNRTIGFVSAMSICSRRKPSRWTMASRLSAGKRSGSIWEAKAEPFHGLFTEVARAAWPTATATSLSNAGS